MSPTAPLPRTLQIGLRRAGGLSMLPAMSAHMLVVGLIGGQPSPFPAQDVLAPALWAFHPPVQVLTFGGAYTDEDAEAAKSVWEAYRAEVDGRPEDYGEEEGEAKVGFVRVTQEAIKGVQAERGGCDVYEAVAEVLVRGVKGLPEKKVSGVG